MPTNMRLVTGNAGKRALPKDEPQVAVSEPDAPEYLCEVGKAEWQKMVKLLAGMRVMSEADVTALALYCDAFARWRHAIAAVNADGAVLETTNGNKIQHPYLQIANKAHDQMLKLLCEFGLTPSSRTRVKTTNGKSPWSDL